MSADKDNGNASRTALSVGLILYKALAESQVNGIVTKVFPVVTSEAQLPYVAYRRRSSAQTAVKGYLTGAETAQCEVACFAAGYGESIDLAERVRQAVESAQGIETGGVRCRSCVMTDSSEEWRDDAYVQLMVFELRVDRLTASADG